MEGFKSLQPPTADACFYISLDPFYPYSRPDAKEPPAESKGHEYCGRHHMELAYLSSEEDLEAIADAAGEWVSKKSIRQN